ncbi:unnamed protein product, partial [marine sediment metagenome]
METSLERIYPKEWPGKCPIFPKAEYWFKWRQRYIYQNPITKEYEYLDGYGEHRPDYEGYKAQTFTSPDGEIKSQMYQRLEAYSTGWKDDEGWTWYLKGVPNMILDGELVSFDYPLVLGKTWHSETTMNTALISLDGVVIAYILPNIESSRDIAVASGYKYEL